MVSRRCGAHDGGAQDVFADATAGDRRGSPRSARSSGSRWTLVFRRRHQDGQQNEAQLGVADALQKHQRLGVRLAQKQESPLVFESREAVGKLKDRAVRIFDITKVSSLEPRHRCEE